MQQKERTSEQKNLFIHTIALTLSALAGALPIDGLVFSHTPALVLSQTSGPLLAGLNGMIGHQLALWIGGGQAFTKSGLLIGLGVFIGVWVFVFLRQRAGQHKKYWILASDLAAIIILTVFQTLALLGKSRGLAGLTLEAIRLPALNAAANVFLAEVILQIRGRQKEKKSLTHASRKRKRKSKG